MSGRIAVAYDDDTVPAEAPPAAPAAKRTSVLRREIGRGRVSRADLMHLSRQLAAFIRAGIPILEGIDLIAAAASSATLRTVLTDVAARLRAGDTLTEAVGAHPRVFPPFYRAVLRSADLTGHLDTVLDQLAHHLARDVDARRKVRSALVYPAVLLVLSLTTVLVLTLLVLPRFRTFFASLDTDLPTTTRILLDTAGFVQSWWVLLVGGSVALVVGVMSALRTRRGRAFADAVTLRLPVIGETVRYAAVERFCRVLASLVEAGVPLPEAVRVAGDATSSAVFVSALSQAREEMIEGDGLAEPLARTGLFPATVGQMLRVGEMTGSLDQQLETAASFYEVELDHRIKRLTTLFEPAVIVGMGLVVGFVAVALVSAMYGVFAKAGEL